MRFVLKAIFFLAVVAAFIPRSPAESAAAPLQASVGEGASRDFCTQNPAVCDAAEESAFAVRIVGGMAVEQARHMIAEAVAEPTPTETAAPAPAP